MGQALLASIVTPPVEGDASYPLFQTEKESILGALQEKADMVYHELNKIPGVQVGRLACLTVHVSLL
eukprot:gene30144-37650_t